MARGGFRRCGGESVSLWRGGGLRRPHFFLRRKKCGKESRLDLRSKDPWRGAGKCKFGGAGFAELVQRSSLSVKRTVPAFTGAEASATACLSHGRGICFYRVGDYQIAPIAARSTAMGRWRLTPPGYVGTCLPAGRSTDLTGHRCVIQHRGPLKGKANGGVSFNTANPARGRLIGVQRQERKTPTVAGASGRGSLRAGERRHSPFDRQR